MDVKTSHAGRRHIAIHSHMPQGTESKHLQPEKHETMLMWMMEMNDYVKKIKKVWNFQFIHYSAVFQLFAIFSYIITVSVRKDILNS